MARYRPVRRSGQQHCGCRQAGHSGRRPVWARNFQCYCCLGAVCHRVLRRRREGAGRVPQGRMPRTYGSRASRFPSPVPGRTAGGKVPGLRPDLGSRLKNILRVFSVLCEDRCSGRFAGQLVLAETTICFSRKYCKRDSISPVMVRKHPNRVCPMGRQVQDQASAKESLPFAKWLR